MDHLPEPLHDLPPTSEEDRLLDEALAMPPGARAAWMAALARDAPTLAARVAAVLAETDAGDGFLSPGGALGGALCEELRQQLSDEPGSPPSLAAGDEVGRYRVVAAIAAGGMGEVYRAHDPKLGRDVAIKVLPVRLQGQRQRVSRLRREARLLAALDHPNIATIHELEEFGETLALVLELVHGPTLAERLESGPLPVADVIGVARQLVDALEAAHARGVVHRDLKPANITFARSGRVKVLDFGIATVLRDVTGTDASSELPVVTTLTLPSGTVIGTAAYMSPEQLRGEPVDRRADVWAFGCVLFEMLAGARAFPGQSAADVMSGVLRQAPDLGRLPAETPDAVRELVGRCLEKDPARRLPQIGEARALLEAAGEPRLAQVSARPRSADGAARRSPWSAWPIVLGLLLGTAVSGLVMWSVMRPAPEPVARLTVALPSGDELVTGALPAVALAPDGGAIVYRARRDGRLQLFRRLLDQAQPSAIPESSNAAAPFFSPDGTWIAFDRDGVLLKVRASGGRPVPICDSGGASAAASWGDRGDIVFAPTTGRGLLRVAAAGGDPVPLTQVDKGRGEVRHALPEVLPGGRAAVFTIERDDGSTIAVVRLDRGEVNLLTEGRQASYAASGHLLVARGDALWAAPFDLEGLRLEAEPVPVLRGLDPTGAAHFAVARNGALLYVPRRELDPPRNIVWIDRQGREEASGIEPGRHLRLSLSPDGTRVALVTSDAGSQDLWVHDLQRRVLRRLTFDPHVDTAPIWTPDGRDIIFRSDRDGGGLFRVSADGAGRPVRLTATSGPFQTPYAVSPDGRTLIFVEFRSYRDQGIGVLHLEDRRQMRMLVDDPFAELRPALSPDGRWLAYQADESGQFEVYLRPFPDVGSDTWRVSRAGGRSPQWGPDGRELFYFEGETLVRVVIAAGRPPAFGPPEPLFAATLFGERLGPLYAVSPDGSRFLVIKDDSERDRVAARRQLQLVQNWFTELELVVPRPR